MASRIIGKIKRVNGPVIEVKAVTDALNMELIKVGEYGLIGEVIKLYDDRAIIQVYEEPTGLSPEDNIYGTGAPMSVELGPGLLGTIYDGIQRPLDTLRDLSGSFIEKGINVPSLNRERLWHFVPNGQRKPGEQLTGGAVLGTVAETPSVSLKIMVPPLQSGTLVSLAEEGDYTVDAPIAALRPLDAAAAENASFPVCMLQRWPIRVPRPVSRRLPLDIPLITGQRVIDTLFPLAKGGTVAIPGGFGTGKTMTQHAIAKWCDADIIVYIGCGERGNEMTDVLTEFPQLVDPRTGKSLMERTVLIANTSNMPVSAREASLYTGVTIAEFFRDMGLHVAIMADSTSRWAEALRELSGRMEEMPAEEGFPAYLPTRIAAFYERAGYMQTLNQLKGSVSIIGAVSPPGGDFSEPVTQHTKRFVRCFWGLDKGLANARHYPAISWLESYSEYVDDLKPYFEKQLGESFIKDRETILRLLQKEVRLQQVVKLVGPDALPDSQRFIIEICTLFKNAFLQQNAFDNIDKYSTLEKQRSLLAVLLQYYRRGTEAIQMGIPLSRIRKMPVVVEMAKMKLTVPNGEEEAFDRLSVNLEKGFAKLEALYAE